MGQRLIAVTGAVLFAGTVGLVACTSGAQADIPFGPSAPVPAPTAPVPSANPTAGPAAIKGLSIAANGTLSASKRMARTTISFKCEGPAGKDGLVVNTAVTQINAAGALQTYKSQLKYPKFACGGDTVSMPVAVVVPNESGGFRWKPGAASFKVTVDPNPGPAVTKTAKVTLR